MKQVTMYKAEDGALFEDADDCASYELRLYWCKRMCEEIDAEDLNTDNLFEWILNNTNGFKEIATLPKGD